ncbi:protein translocase subunit yidC [Eubacterium pyruvativorans]|uniref:Protein translocase subunit yidC n=1 Tax=Eubacterium pyruvativorans TaxID=155865 RepID=A0A1I7HS93_9FIRM|nr:YidC/Oxa1 family membrane protein insertase [Eubacterium pyruvativorans]SFO30240.1 protein translocase subunit yidC [Eubacterium pyruvativorans]SFU63567.1 protein translocase subunit yidC [Eubacterium pyruvativorans]
MNFFGIMAQPLGVILKLLYGVIGNYGITLIILTLIVKLCLYPAYKRQIMSMAGMGDLQPKMTELQKKYGADREKMSMEMEKLYKEENIHPMAGCLPMAIQMFIIMGLFALLRNPLNYISSADTNMIFAIHEQFLWINDLSQPDPWILPILSGVATFAATYMSQAMGAGTLPGGSQAQGKAMNMIMKYGFPIMIIWLAKTYAAGLATYWFISQFIQIFYNIRFAQLRNKLKEEQEEKKRKRRKPVRAGQGVKR